VTQKNPSLLLLIPAYNEEARIEPVLREYANYFRKNYAGECQLVVVLNGCVDNTVGVVKREHLYALLDTLADDVLRADVPFKTFLFGRGLIH